eukprot:SAG11_NODE_5144_length_1651_cov_1.095361_3_plen_204_part_00
MSGFVRNRPGYLQWNIALYEDDVFWVLPGSHLVRALLSRCRPSHVRSRVLLRGAWCVWPCCCSALAVATFLWQRPATDAEEADLAATAQLTSRHDGRPPSKTNSGPIGAAVPVHLRAGDGVVYLNCILHWGSDYSARVKRRTLHFGYRAFNNGSWTQVSKPMAILWFLQRQTSCTHRGTAAAVSVQAGACICYRHPGRVCRDL